MIVFDLRNKVWATKQNKSISDGSRKKKVKWLSNVNHLSC